ncbi:MAG: class I SAM-dependent methyltransferase [Candidatus Delongbacteria bacterium]|jgi:predicted O-methyltransferase YrrM|nr:class I SAM-dependent methyltransferase [Candidatus Delongbacteria bacterium]
MYIFHELSSRNLKHISVTDLPALIQETLVSKAQPYSVTKSLDYLHKLRKIHQKIEVMDLGAGSKKMSKKRSISDIATYSVSGYSELRLLARLAYFKNPTSILELGSSLGVSGIALANSAPNARVLSVEGCPNTYQYACEHIQPYLTGNLQFVNAEFESFLQNNDIMYDMISIDGNHRYDATLRLFDKASSYLNPGGVIIIDDIYWSVGMHRAWNKIKQRENYMAIDLYQSGILAKGKQGNQRIRLKG